MNSNWFKIILKDIKVEYGMNLTLKGIPVIFNKKGASPLFLKKHNLHLYKCGGAA